MTQSRLSREQIEEAAAMRDRGLTIGQIARRFGVSPGCIAWHCLAEGADPPHLIGAALPPVPTTPIQCVRGNHIVRRFTRSEDRRILELAKAGLSPTRIGRAIGRKQNSIRGRLLTLARRDARAEAVGP